MKNWMTVTFCALILIMISSAEVWAQRPGRKVSTERAQLETKMEYRTWRGTTANGGLDPYADASDYQSPSSREELEAEKQEAMEERERLHAEWAVNPSPREQREEERSGDLRVGETDVILTSWYGPGFQGNTTASGEEFNMDEISAAHKDWPLGTKVKLRNLENRLTIVVVINDRGPYYEERGLDLSRAAAEALGMVDEGVVWLEYQILEIPPQ